MLRASWLLRIANLLYTTGRSQKYPEITKSLLLNPFPWIKGTLQGLTAVWERRECNRNKKYYCQGKESKKKTEKKDARRSQLPTLAISW